MRATGLVVSLLTMLLGSAWPTPSAAQSLLESAFGPRKYARGAGRPEGIVEAFHHCGTGPCQMVVLNGDGDPAHRVSSAEVLLNGTQIVGPSDFNQQVNKIIKPVALADENELVILLRSQPGTFLTIEIECTPAILSAGAWGATLLEPRTLLIAFPIKNTGLVAAEDVQVTSIIVSGGVIASPTLPVNLGTIPPDGQAVLDADATGAFTPLGSYGLTVEGTYNAGAATSCFKLDIPLRIPPEAPGSARLKSGTVAALSVSGAPFPPEPPAFDREPNEERGWTVPITPFVPGARTPTATGTQAPPLEAVGPQAGASILFDGNYPLGFGAGTVAEPSGASGGGVIFMTVNSFAAYSTNGGITFTKLDPTTIFPNNYDGGFCCDQIVQYVPSIDRFIWLMLFAPDPSSRTNRMRIASASPATIIATGGRRDWACWDLTSGFFEISGWMDFPDLSVGTNYLYISCNQVDKAGVGLPSDPERELPKGLLVARIPLGHIQTGAVIGVDWTPEPWLSPMATFSHLTQNTGDEVFWAGLMGTSRMRLFSLAEGSNFFFYRDREVSSWARNVHVSTTPDDQNWMELSSPYVLGATRAGNELWFAWTSGADQAFPQPYIRMVTLDRSNDFSVIRQVQIWNPTIAFGFPALATNGCTSEVGFSLEYGGGGEYQNHAVGFWGDFVAYPTTASDVGITSFGDYLTIRQQPPSAANPGNLFDAFGYGLNTVPSPGEGVQTDVRYISFGRPVSSCIPIPAPGFEVQETFPGRESPRAAHRDLAITAVTPHPFTREATITFVLPRRGRVVATVFDFQGRSVRTLLDEDREAGAHELRWSGTGAGGARLKPGAYVVAISVNGAKAARSVIKLE